MGERKPQICLVSGHDLSTIDTAKYGIDKVFKKNKPDIFEFLNTLKDKVVVIVDDEERVIEALKFNLEMTGAKVFDFTDPKLALEKIKEIKPDVVVSDLNMPEMSGFDLALEIRNVDSK